jgi:hypothetical protein
MILNEVQLAWHQLVTCMAPTCKSGFPMVYFVICFKGFGIGPRTVKSLLQISFIAYFLPEVGLLNVTIGLLGMYEHFLN